MKIIKKDYVLFALNILILVVCSISILRYGAGYLDSDSAAAYFFADSVIDNKSYFPDSWNYANGDAWSIYPLIAPLSVIIHPFVKSAIEARLLVCVIQLIIVFLTMLIISRKAFGNNSWVVIFPLLSLFLFGVKYYILYDGCYGDFSIYEPLICIILAGTMATEKFKTKISGIVVLELLIYLLSLRGIRTAADFIFPLFLTVLVFEIVEHDSIRIKQLIGNGLLVLLPSVLGLYTYNHIALSRNVNNVFESRYNFPDEFRDLIEGAINTIVSIFEIFGYTPGVKIFSIAGVGNFVSITMCVIVCIIVPYLQAKTIGDENIYVKFTYVFSLVHLSIFFLCGMILDFVSKYHMISSVVLLCVISGRYIYENWIKLPQKGILWVALFVFASSILCINLLTENKELEKNIQSKKKVVEELNKHNLKKGYATFWNSKIFSLFSDDITIGAIVLGNENFVENWWLCDSKLFDESEGKSFLLISETEIEHDANIYEKIYGFIEPCDEFTIDDVYMTNQIDGEYVQNYKVFVYNCDYSTYFINGIVDGVLKPDEMYFNGSGKKNDDCILLEKDGVVYGPYTRVPSGKYNVTYIGDNLDNADIDIMTEEEGKEVSYDIISISTDSIEAVLDVNQTVELMQFRMFNNTTDSIRFDIINIEKIN